MQISFVVSFLIAQNLFYQGQGLCIVTLNFIIRSTDIVKRLKDEESKTASADSGSDQVIISQEGRDGVEAWLNTMTKEDFMDMVKQWQSENQTRLEVDPYWKVDPDKSIATQIYFESYITQLEDNRKTIEAYYTDAYQEALSSPLGNDTTAALSFIAGRYLCSWSSFFKGDLSAHERQWTYNQLNCMLNGTGVALNDPYALTASGGPKTVEEMDKIARQAVKEKLDALIRERETLVADEKTFL